MTERNRGRVHLTERRRDRNLGRPWGSSSAELDAAGYELPDAPENPEFASLFTPEQAERIETRFLNGIELGQIYDARAARLAREASLECHARFHKPRRPDRKQRAFKAKLGDIAHRPGSR